VLRQWWSTQNKPRENIAEHAGISMITVGWTKIKAKWSMIDQVWGRRSTSCTSNTLGSSFLRMGARRIGEDLLLACWQNEPFYENSDACRGKFLKHNDCTPCFTLDAWFEKVVEKLLRGSCTSAVFHDSQIPRLFFSLPSNTQRHEHTYPHHHPQIWWRQNMRLI